jgi:glycosyltransferase involved in cell wall biosynthesis
MQILQVYNNMINVVFDHQIFGWQKYGGISRYFYELATKINSGGDISLEILAPRYITRYFDEENSLNIHGHFLESTNLHPRLLRSMNYFLANVKVRNFKPDIIHETYFAAMGYSKPKKTKTVLTVYDLIHEKFPEYFSKYDPTIYEKKRAIERADHILAISHHTKADLLEFYDIPEEKITVTQLGFDLQVSHSITPVIPKISPYILFVGNRGGHKNFSNLLIAYQNNKALCDNFKLVCFGGGQFTEAERYFMKSLGVSDNNLVQVTGDDGVLSQYYQNASVFVYPSEYEGFGIPPLEAMNYSCPVVCSNVSSIPEVVGQAGHYFDPLDTVDIGEKIEDILFDNQLSDHLISSGRDRLTQFSWERCAAETTSVYKKVLS